MPAKHPPPGPGDNTSSGTQEASQHLRENIERSTFRVVEERERQAAADAAVDVVASEFFEGPLPHPSHLERYELLQKGFAERLLTMAEREQAAMIESNRRRMDFAWRNLELTRSSERVGTVVGFCAFLVSLSGALVAALLDSHALAIAILSTAVLGCVGIFVQGRRP